MSTQKICADSHEPIPYTSEECPLCVARKHLGELVDSKEDSNQKNILELFTASLLTREIAQDFGYLS